MGNLNTRFRGFSSSSKESEHASEKSIEDIENSQNQQYLARVKKNEAADSKGEDDGSHAPTLSADGFEA